MERRLIIAVDGPASSGKSTVSKRLAKHYEILHLDTGAMYRAAAYKALCESVDICDASAVVALLDKTDIAVKYLADGTQQVMVDGVDVMGKIRTNEVSKAASDIAVIPAVRLKLVELQRKIAEKQSVVMDGRDIGTYVLPNADFKFFVTAAPEERAKRRLLELQEKGIDAGKTLEEMTAEIVARDKTDSTREFAPLVRADDAILIDTTELTIEEVLNCAITAIDGK